MFTQLTIWMRGILGHRKPLPRMNTCPAGRSKCLECDYLRDTYETKAHIIRARMLCEHPKAVHRELVVIDYQQQGTCRPE